MIAKSEDETSAKNNTYYENTDTTGENEQWAKRPQGNTHFRVTSSAAKYEAAVGAYVVTVKQKNDPAIGKMPQGIEAQSKQCFENLKAILAGHGMTLDNVVKTTVFLTDLGDFKAMNEVYSQYFSSPFPARSTMQVAALPLGTPIEVECIAVK